MSSPMEAARRVADAVLYEGYLLYPYRASATKNQMRWQFGVLVPPGFSATDEPVASVTDCLLDGAHAAELDLRLRFLHVRSRIVEAAIGNRTYRPVNQLTADGQTYLTFDDATEREVRVDWTVQDLLAAERTVDVCFPGDRTMDQLGGGAGRIVCEHQPLEAVLAARAEQLPGPYGLIRLRVQVENTAVWARPDAPRDQALRRSLIATHLLIGLSSGGFVSLLDPPEWAREAATSCRNENTFPVLAGEPGRRDLLLSSPIILYDHPTVAPESPGDMFDATEIDELLSLRTRTLTEEEKAQARATDPRAAHIVDHTAELTPELAERLHGTFRHFGVGQPGGTTDVDPTPPSRDTAVGPTTRSDTGDGQPGDDAGVAPTAPGDDAGVAGTAPSGARVSPTPPSRDTGLGRTTPSDDAGVSRTTPRDESPPTCSVVIAGVTVRRGSRVRLVPGIRPADAHDMFLTGRTARVEDVLLDADGAWHLAVTLDDDPGADLHRAHGRFRYFAPDEVEPLSSTTASFDLDDTQPIDRVSLDTPPYDAAGRRTGEEGPV